MAQYVAPNIEFGTWSLGMDGCGATDSKYMESIAAEPIEIAGAVVNVFRMLGIHEQGKLQNLTNSGNPISSGTAPGALLHEAFTDSSESWISKQKGDEVLTAFIGYNFGVKLNPAGTPRHDPPAPVYQEITTLRIKQGANPENRVLQAKIERSDDGGITWKRVDIVNLPNSNVLETVPIKQSSKSQLWRIVPLYFAGGAEDHWVVEQLQFMNFTQTSIDNVQDLIFMENRDRDYSLTSIPIKAYYDLIDNQTELAKFGIDLPQQYEFTCSFARMVELLGRPIVVGDILELPSEAQYDHHLNEVKKWLEVTDTAWSLDGFTPAWRPVLFKFTAQPAIASSENMDLFKSEKGHDAVIDSSFELFETHLNTQPITASEAIKKDALDDVPEVGTDSSGIASGMAMLSNQKGSYDGRDYSVEDGMPPNNLPFTEGPEFPAGAKDGDYHRMTYDPSTRLPAKLYQWNHVKNRWIYLETDRRIERSSFRPSIRNRLESNTRINIDEKF